MEASPEALAVLRAFEGPGPKDDRTGLFESYFDGAGIGSVGYGHVVLDASGRPIRKNAPNAAGLLLDAVVAKFGASEITTAEATELLGQDVQARTAQLLPLVAGVQTTQAQFDALMVLGFNVGFGAVRTSTVLARHKAGIPVSRTLDFLQLEASSRARSTGTGIEGAFAAWSFSEGVWTLGLFRRRMAEVMLYRGDGSARAIPAAQALR